MEEAITKDNIFIAKCVKYSKRDGDYLVRKPLSIDEQYRKILFFRGKVIDFETAEDLSILPIDNITGEINGTIECDTLYIEEAYECVNLTNKDMEYIPTLLNLYQEKKIMEKSRKLIKYPKKLLN